MSSSYFQSKKIKEQRKESLKVLRNNKEQLWQRDLQGKKKSITEDPSITFVFKYTIGKSLYYK